MCIRDRLGIGTAIIYALYKPLAEKDELKIAALMNLYARVYHIIGCIIAVLGIALLPFLDWIIGELPHVQHITLIYLMFLFNSVASYFFVYKRSLLIANQLDSISTMNQIIFLVIQYTLQMILLWLTGNYLLYLGVQLLCVFASNVMLSLIHI